ncbi:hypothetical protein TCAL_10748 [Tigriopus californicus]|uniref:Kelch-like protein diablo n=1 Tax=Tigriopus californicus TaxID=6832 RepID=A0A553NTH7_TIGCA|nr:hypothetical protein TCAL_10748 [Tigriopus californicus]|eukprot:TCALIF_10748-PA protein Name:"Similar to klhl3 Kelch-like protein 3 (Danio rerio)" AED:0.09 eAED:0.09 QI:0/-1/0/1/-1/1/1/0/632
MGPLAGNGYVHEDDDWDIELVVQGREIVVSEQLLVLHSKYFARVFGQLDSEQDTVVLKRDLGLDPLSRDRDQEPDEGNVQSNASNVSGGCDGGGGGGSGSGSGSSDGSIPTSSTGEPLTQISHATMATLVEFFYSGNLQIAEHNVKHLMEASDLLAIESVDKQCFTFLASNVSISNCVKRFIVADGKPAWRKLAKKLLHFIQLHFDSLMKLTQIYQLTSHHQFKRILAGERLAVPREEKTLEAVLEWVQYESERYIHLYTLLQEVQWPLVKSRETLINALKDPYISYEERCINLVYEALQYQELGYEQKLEFWKDPVRGKKPNRWPKLLAALPYAGQLIECFDFETLTWAPLTNKPTADTFGAEMCYLDGKIYTLGGVQMKTVDQFDVETTQWAVEFPSLLQYRVAHGVTSDDERIYVTGGSAKASRDFGPGLNEMEILQSCSSSPGSSSNTNTNTTTTSNSISAAKWIMGSSMDVGRSYLASALLHEPDDPRHAGDLFVVGGCLTETVSTAEVYDSRTRKWRTIANTLSKRDSLALVSLDGELYAVGGFNNLENKYLKSAERYDPTTDTWTEINSMQVGRRSPGVVRHKGKIYAVGGMGESEDLKSVEVYDVFQDQWKKFPHPMRDTCGEF